MSQPHGERKHSKFSASGSDRWHACPGSVELSEGVPSKDSIYSIEGTKGHEVLETVVNASLALNSKTAVKTTFGHDVPKEMVGYAMHAANHVLSVYGKAAKATDIMVEERVLLGFIHPEAFGSLDYAIVEHFGTLHIMDYKYGMTPISPKENLQFIFYALATAYKYDWNFKRVRMWTLQPRIKGFDGYLFWDISIAELMAYIPKFRKAVKRVEENPDMYVEGGHCHWCPSKGICPLKQQGRMEKAKSVFTANPIKRGK